jgi:hypothetical protein
VRGELAASPPALALAKGPRTGANSADCQKWPLSTGQFRRHGPPQGMRMSRCSLIIQGKNSVVGTPWTTVGFPHPCPASLINSIGLTACFRKCFRRFREDFGKVEIEN